MKQRIGEAVRRIFGQLTRLGARGLTANALGLVAVTLSIFDYASWALLCAAVTLGLVLFFTRLLAPWQPRFRRLITGAQPARVLGSYSLSRTLVALAIGLSALWHAETAFVAWGPALFFAMMIIFEPVLATATNISVSVVTNAPWASSGGKPPFGRSVIFLLNTFGLVVALVLVAFGLSPVPAVVFPLVSLSLASILVVDARARVQRNRRIKADLNADLTAYAPRFMLYWEAAVGTTYQVEMWLPYLDQLGEKYVVVLRNARNAALVAPLTQAPIIICGPMADLDDVVVPSLRTTFYVNNAIRNCHFVRYPQLTHIQLNHGDSDKAPSFNPVMRMYDRNFVAGQAAVDRFAANGIDVRDDFFTIVGRPQVADLLIGDSSVTQPGQKTVLYAPTWAGFMADSNHSSLLVGPQLVAALIGQGANVIFRPHPHARKDLALAEASDRVEKLLKADHERTGATHVFGPTAEVEMTIFECFDLSDAMISDVSSVVPDYLFSEKPLALVAVNSTYEDFMTNNPIATAAYVIDQTLGNLSAVLNDFLAVDTMKVKRRQVKGHYLGDFGDRDYGQVFIDEARRYV